LLSRSSALAFIIASGLLLSIIVILFVENKTISKRKQAEKEREKLIAELQDAAAKIKILRGMLPICSNCKKVRDDKGYWNQIESYIREHSEAEFTHSMCPLCAKKLYPELFQK
jgi:DNA repair exonuclease SbcCD ATPase subunit